LTLNPDSSEDHELKIKGIPDIKIGNYSQDDLLNQQHEAEEALALARAADEQRKKEAQHLGQDNEKASESNEDAPLTSEEDLLQALSQCIKHKPGWQAKDCYFTAKEAEAGDPLIVDNPAQETTEDENDLADSWDNNDEEEFDPDADMKDTGIEDNEEDYDMSKSP
jgi:uncharacterized protein YqfA (UPF0365 family)